MRGSEDGCGAEHRAVAAAAAAGRDRGRRGLRLARVALSRGAEAARAAWGLGGRSAQPTGHPPHHGQRGGRS